MKDAERGESWREKARRVGSYLWIGMVNPGPPPLPSRGVRAETARVQASAPPKPEPEVTGKTGLLRCPCCADPVVITLTLTTVRDGWTNHVTATATLQSPEDAADGVPLDDTDDHTDPPVQRS